MTQHSAPYLAARGHGCDLDEGVERHLDVGQLRQRLVQEVGQDAAQHGLVGDQHYVLLSENRSNVTVDCFVRVEDDEPLQLHDDRLEPGHQVLVALPARVAVGQLVVVPRCELRGEPLGDLLG